MTNRANRKKANYESKSTYEPFALCIDDTASVRPPISPQLTTYKVTSTKFLGNVWIQISALQVDEANC